MGTINTAGKRSLLLLLTLCLLGAAFTGCRNAENGPEAVPQETAADPGPETAARDSADEVSAMIEALGSITLKDADAVEAARQAYDDLSEEQRARVKKVSDLEAAEDKLHSLTVKQQASAIDSLIQSVRKVSLDSRETVRAVRAAYDAADPEVKKQVRLLATLKKAEKKIRKLEAEAAAAEFDAAVAALGEVTLESEDEVRAVREAYDALDEEVRSAVTSQEELARAEETLVFLKKKARAGEMDAAIAALGTVTLSSEKDVRTLRRQYASLPEDVRELVTAGETLTKAEVRIRTLKDQAAGAEVSRLVDAGKYSEAIDYAEDYMEGREIWDVRGGVVRYCLDAYAAEAEKLIRRSRYEEAYDLLRFCRSTYAGADLSGVNRTWNELKRATPEPYNGRMFASTAVGGYSTLTIKAGDTPVLVKIIKVTDSDSRATVYVRAKKSATVKLKTGTYTIRFATGEKWFNSKILFGSGTQYITLDNNYRFEVRTNGKSRYASALKLTLVPVPGGKETYSVITADEF